MICNNLFVGIILVAGLTALTEASGISKELRALELENNDEDFIDTTYDENFEGKTDQLYDYCYIDPCKNGGTCVNQVNGYDCICSQEFYGSKCEAKVTDPCVSNKCQNGGYCKAYGRDFICECKDPYWGDKCQNKCDCVNGECHRNTEGHLRCICNPGFGKYSEHECRDFCEHSPCKHGGTCENIANDYKCNCPKDYYGKNCECTCKNGECKTTAQGRFECVCKPEYGLYDDKECRACDCGKGINCTFETSFLFGDDKYCLCPGGVKSKNKACEETCDNSGKITCGAKGLLCKDDTINKGYTCEYCLPNYQKKDDDSGDCEPKTCDDAGEKKCAETFKKCTKLTVEGAQCGDCLTGYFRKADDSCAAETCDDAGEKKCAETFKKCTNLTVEGAQCGDCLTGYFRKSDDSCAAETCDDAGRNECKESFKVCTKLTVDGPQCGACLAGYFRKSDDSCAAETCDDAGKKKCAVAFKKCNKLTAYGAECGDCLTGYFTKLDDSCAAETCDERGKIECAESFKECSKLTVNGAQCGACLDGYFRKSDDSCAPDETCGERGDDACRSVFKKCVKRVNNKYKCGDCLRGYIRDVDGKCVFASCEYIGSYMCSRMYRKCVDQLDVGYKCGGCLNDSFTEEYGTCVKATCKNIGGFRCYSLKRECRNDQNGYQCGKCTKGFVEFEGRKECVKECSCENGECKYNDKMEPYCSCFRGFGLLTSKVCKACNCGKGVGCFYGIRNRVLNKYCECPSGNRVIDGPCTVTCKNIGFDFCGEMNRTCTENTAEGYDCGECKDGFVEDAETKKCVTATCANKGNQECGNFGRKCLNDTGSAYKCGGCLVGFLPVEGSDSCSLDLCQSSPCQNSGICKVVNDTFRCFCLHPFFGETCEQEIVSTTMLPSTTTNYTSPTLPDGITNSTTTVDVEYSTESSNFTRDFHRTTETTKTTAGYSKTSIDSNATSSLPTTTTSLPSTTTTPEVPTKSDRGLKFIFRNVHTVQNLTEVIVKS